MNNSFAPFVIGFLVVIAIHGCNDITLPAGELAGSTAIDEPALHVLEPSQVHPTSAQEGDDVTVFGGHLLFPTGYYRVTFTGGTTVEFFQATATSALTIEIPSGATSGPFGFIVGSRTGNGVTVGGASPDGFATYTVREPGIRIVNANPWIP